MKSIRYYYKLLLIFGVVCSLNVNEVHAQFESWDDVFDYINDHWDDEESWSADSDGNEESQNGGGWGDEGFYYDWDTGVYRDSSGDEVAFDDVHDSLVDDGIFASWDSENGVVLSEDAIDEMEVAINDGNYDGWYNETFGGVIDLGVSKISDDIENAVTEKAIDYIVETYNIPEEQFANNVDHLLASKDGFSKEGVKCFSDENGKVIIVGSTIFFYDIILTPKLDVEGQRIGFETTCKITGSREMAVQKPLQNIGNPQLRLYVGGLGRELVLPEVNISAANLDDNTFWTGIGNSLDRVFGGVLDWVNRVGQENQFSDQTKDLLNQHMHNCFKSLVSSIYEDSSKEGGMTDAEYNAALNDYMRDIENDIYTYAETTTGSFNNWWTKQKKDIEQTFKDLFKENVVDMALYARDVYVRFDALLKKHPEKKGEINAIVDKLHDGMGLIVDQNTQTMGWHDLVNIWLFELGEEVKLEFDKDDRTTQDLMKQDGVNEARAGVLEDVAHDMIKASYSYVYTYGVDQFYQTTMATAFLGSYHIKIDYEVNTSKTFVTINFTVTNTTGWESGTRFLPDGPDKDKVHDSIIPDKVRGRDIHMGGNLKETWKWEEIIPLKF